MQKYKLFKESSYHVRLGDPLQSPEPNWNTRIHQHNKWRLAVYIVHCNHVSLNLSLADRTRRRRRGLGIFGTWLPWRWRSGLLPPGFLSHGRWSHSPSPDRENHPSTTHNHQVRECMAHVSERRDRTLKCSSMQPMSPMIDCSQWLKAIWSGAM